MKLKKYKVVVNQYGHYFNDGDDYSYYTSNSSDCIEVPDNDEEMPASTAHRFSNGNSSLLTAIGDKPSKITIEF